MARLRLTRRRCLTGLVASLAAGTAGCGSTLGGTDPETPSPTPSYRHLKHTSVYVAPGVELSVPERVPTASEPGKAGVVVLSGSTDVEAGTALGWLTGGAGVGLLGSDAEPTLIRWLRSDAFEAAFDSSAYADATPDPDFLVAFAVGREFVSTHRFTWGDSDAPTDREMLGAINEALRERPTPQG
ncbi:MAG: hypothetical protein ABEI39_06115 [Halobacteriales archaeon]